MVQEQPQRGPIPSDRSAQDADEAEDALDDQPDGDRQLTTDSAMIDTGLNDSDLGTEASGDMADKRLSDSGTRLTALPE